MNEKNNFKEISSNWHYVLPPSRPTVAEIERIRSYLSPLDRGISIAILGSTIEFRDLLASMEFSNVTVLEKNSDFYIWTKKWMAFSPVENVIYGDWREILPSKERCFAVILSDLTMGNIPYEDRNVFYITISKALCPGGVFIDKVLTHDESLISLEQLKVTYDKLPINLHTINRFNCEALFCSELLRDGVIDTTLFYEKLKTEFADSLKLLKIIEKCYLITPEKCLWYYGRSWKEVSECYYRHFSRTVEYPDSIESPYYGRSRQLFNFA